MRTHEKIRIDTDGAGGTLTVWHISPIDRGECSVAVVDLDLVEVENLAASLRAWLEDCYRRHEEDGDDRHQ